MSAPEHRPVAHRRRARQPIRVAVSLEGRLEGAALAALLASQEDFCVLGPVRTGDETAALCARHRPHVLVLGALGDWPRPLAAATVIRLVSPGTRVLAYAPHTRDRCAHLNPRAAAGAAGPRAAVAACLARALQGGAQGALDGDAEPQALFRAVRALARGERWDAPHDAPPAPGHTPSLSPQELRVARLVGQGASNKEIASALAISDLTVKKHVGNIFHKLALHDRLQLGLRVARDPSAFEDDGPRD